MKKLLCMCLAGVVASAVAPAYAGNPFKLSRMFKSPKARLTNYQPAAIEPAPMPSGAMPGAAVVAPGSEPTPAAGTPVTLYHCVRYKDECNVAPCAVPMIVTVKDPCDCSDRCNPCCTPKCVAVQICVPPCSECPPKVCCKRDGEYVSYDYGKYRVEITSRNGVVTVDYDD